MSIDLAPRHQRPRRPQPSRLTDHGRRLTTETKSAFKTTEFIAYVAVLAGILIAGAVTKASTSSAGVHHGDVFAAHQVWLYATIVTVGYMISVERFLRTDG